MEKWAMVTDECKINDELYEQLMGLFKDEDERELKKEDKEYVRSFWSVSPDNRKSSQVIMNKPRNLIRKVIR